MIEIAISIEGNFLTGLNRVSIWGFTTGTVVASEVGIMYIFDLNEDSFTQSACMELGEYTYRTTVILIVSSANNIPGRCLIDRVEDI
jgi:hypothetical protein